MTSLEIEIYSKNSLDATGLYEKVLKQNITTSEYACRMSIEEWINRAKTAIVELLPSTSQDFQFAYKFAFEKQLNKYSYSTHANEFRTFLLTLIKHSRQYVKLVNSQNQTNSLQELLMLLYSITEIIRGLQDAMNSSAR